MTERGWVWLTVGEARIVQMVRVGAISRYFEDGGMVHVVIDGVDVMVGETAHEVWDRIAVAEGC